MGNGNFIIRYRWLIMALTLAILVCSVVCLRKITINPDLETYLPATMTEKRHTDQIAELFGASEPVIIVFETNDILESHTLVRIGNLSREFNEMKEFRSVISLTEMKDIKGEQGAMIVEPIVSGIPGNDIDKERLRREIGKNNLVYRVIVSEDFKYTIIILVSNKSDGDANLLASIRQKIDDFPGPEKVYLNGQPYLRDEANNKISRDILLLLPLGLIAMLAFLWISFREVRGVLLPFSVVLFSIVFSMALIPLLGWELSLIGILLPVMMIAIANNYGVYFIIRYQELNAKWPEATMADIVKDTFIFLKKPVTLCGLTTMAGVMGLTAHILLPARQLGVVATIGIGFALLLSLFYIPAVLSALKKGKTRNCFTKNPDDLISKILTKAGIIITEHPGKVILTFAIFICLSAFGLARFRIAPDSNRILPEKHQFNKALTILDNHFGGNKLIQVLFQGDFRSPELLKRLDEYETKLKKLPQVGTATSLATMVRKMSTALNDPGDGPYDKIPDTREAVAQYIELYNMSGDQDDFSDLVDFEYTNGLLTIQYHTSSIKETSYLVDTIRQLLKDDPDLAKMGGYSLIDKKISESAANGQYMSLLVAFLVILILLAIIFRRWTAGFLGSLPLAFTVLCTLGFMGWTGIELSIVTALLSSVSIGLGVDFTIHVFWRLTSELNSGETYPSAIKKMLAATGRGIAINAFSVMLGFSVLLFSAFPLIRSFALLIILSLLLCLLCALLLIPSICLIIRPKFLNAIHKELNHENNYSFDHSIAFNFKGELPERRRYHQEVG